MRHTHKREIDGTIWTVNEFSASEGIRLLSKITKLCGPSVAKALSGLPQDTEGPGLGVDFSVIGEAISELTGRMDEDEVLELIKRLVACTVVDGEDCGGARFDRVFQGRYLTLVKVVGFVLEANYKLPLGGLLQSGLAAAR